MRAALNADRSAVLMRGRFWRGQFPVSELDSWIAFYTRLRDRKGGAYAASYQSTVDALAKVSARIAK